MKLYYSWLYLVLKGKSGKNTLFSLFLWTPFAVSLWLKTLSVTHMTDSLSVTTSWPLWFSLATLKTIGYNSSNSLCLPHISPLWAEITLRQDDLIPMCVNWVKVGLCRLWESAVSSCAAFRNNNFSCPHRPKTDNLTKYFSVFHFYSFYSITAINIYCIWEAREKDIKIYFAL